MEIKITQGFYGDNLLKPADFNIIIDVVRAFTVCNFAFMKGINKIILVNEINECLNLKSASRDLILAGEVNGYKIEGFDLGNSPREIIKSNSLLQGKNLVLRTTNGVKATLNCLEAKEVLVAGLVDLQNIAQYLKEIDIEDSRINIIASHPTSNEDLACAKYLKGLLTENQKVCLSEVKNSIQTAEAVQKFYDPSNKDFDEEDIHLCLKEFNNNFVMKVNKNGRYPVVERFDFK
ncbi:2-phosphosulfolactate phosphatase [Halobacillus litoralis]|uniref:2-phosphosulfolactate phosphatase n=1 Tax=Halobacillus litoralis TaxID=45668 RepID=UPI001CD44568|nr:2-phosphosulfolactate phosphatase [Halobacillus litoralis]MCA0971584.1 2-phosphosulfolactate phosphatase [Halobacillus litoralis]